jgi:transcription initiation factor TFIIH subunit 3
MANADTSITEISKNLHCIIVDCHSLSWYERDGIVNGLNNGRFISFDDMARSIVIFINSFLIANKFDSDLMVVFNYEGGCEVIYPIVSSESNRVDNFQPKPVIISSILFENFVKVGNNIMKQFENTQNKMYKETNDSLFYALAKCLCVINKRQKTNITAQGKILVIQLALDSYHHYDSIMDSIFSATKLGVSIDALVLSNEASSFLQQACLLTKGAYIHNTDNQKYCTLQSLIMHSFPDIVLRDTLEVPIQKSVRFRSSCTCHNRIVEFAHMCTLCFSLVCDVKDECPICKTKIKK